MPLKKKGRHGDMEAVIQPPLLGMYWIKQTGEFGRARAEGGKGKE